MGRGQTDAPQTGDKKSKSLLGQILVVGSGGAAAQVLAVAATPIITRLYTPEAYGVWALLLGITTIIGTLATLRYELAIVLPTEKEMAANVFLLSIGLSFGVALTAFPLFFFFGNRIGPLLGVEPNSPWLHWLPLLIAANGIIQSCQYWCVREQRFSTLAASSIALVVLTAGSQITFALLGLGNAFGLTIGTILGQTLCGFGLFSVILRKDGRLIRQTVSWPTLRGAAATYRNYPLFMTPYTLVGVLRERLVLFLLNFYAPKAEVGYFAFSTRLVNLPVGLVSSAIRPVFFQKASSSPLPEVESFLVKTLRHLIQLAAPYWVAFLFAAPFIFDWVFGSNWRSSSGYAVMLAVPAFAILLSNWMDRLLDVLGRQDLAFKMEVVFSTLSVSSFVVGLIFLKDVKLAVAIQAGVLLLYYLFWMAKVFHVAGFRLKKLAELARFFLIITGVSGLLLLVMWQLLPVPWAITGYLVIAGGYTAIILKPALTLLRGKRSLKDGVESGRGPKRLSIHLTLTDGSHESRLLREARFLLERELVDEVIVYAMDHPELLVEEQPSAGVRIRRLRLKSRLLPRWLCFQIVKSLEWGYRVWLDRRQNPPYTMTTHHLEALPVALALKLLWGGAVIYSPHELETESSSYRGFRKWVAKRLERALIYRVDSTIVVNDSIAEWYRLQYGINAISVRNIPSVPKAAATTSLSLRQKFSIPEDRLICLTMGRLAPGRGIEVAVRACSQLAGRVHLVLLGEGPWESQVRDWEKRYPNIHYHPAVRPEEVAAVAATADLGLVLIEPVCQSYYYSLPNKFFECLAAGIPVVASDFPEMRSWVVQHQLGWVTEPTETALVNVLRRLQSGQVALAKKRVRGFKGIPRWESEASKLELAYGPHLGGVALPVPP